LFNKDLNLRPDYHKQWHTTTQTVGYFSSASRFLSKRTSRNGNTKHCSCGSEFFTDLFHQVKI